MVCQKGSRNIQPSQVQRVNNVCSVKRKICCSEKLEELSQLQHRCMTQFCFCIVTFSSKCVDSKPQKRNDSKHNLMIHYISDLRASHYLWSCNKTTQMHNFIGFKRQSLLSHNFGGAQILTPLKYGWFREFLADILRLGSYVSIFCKREYFH